MEDHPSTRHLKRAEFTQAASTPTMSKRPGPDVLEERSDLQPESVSGSPLLLPSSDSSQKIHVPLAYGANSDPSASSTPVIGNNYHVECNDVRNMLGKFGDAFRRRKDRFDKEVKRQGKEALKKVLDFRVFESEKFASGHEATLVKELVEIIMREQQHNFQPHLPLNLVGIEDRVAEVMKSVDIACPDIRYIGIWGMGGIGSLKKLKTLSATLPCYKAIGLSLKIHSSIGKLGELVELDLSYTGIEELPESIGELNKLKILRIGGGKIKRLPSSIGKLQSLQEFDASRCRDLEGEIHLDKGGLSSLKTLRLGQTKISRLPENIVELSSLEHLGLCYCRELQSLPKPPVSLSSLRLTCRSNELPSLSHLKHLKELQLWSCTSLQSIPELPSCIQTLIVRNCPKLERLPKLSNLEFLSELVLWECYVLKELDGLEALKSLRRLDLCGTSISNLGDLDVKADHLHAIEGLEKLGSLEALDISGCKHIQVLDLSKSEHLKELDVRNCKSLVEIRCPSKSLERFERDGCKSLQKLPDFLPSDEEFNYEFDEETDEEFNEFDEETYEEFNYESDDEVNEVDEESDVETDETYEEFNYESDEEVSEEFNYESDEEVSEEFNYEFDEEVSEVDEESDVETDEEFNYKVDEESDVEADEE
ncbi:hypothetical protein NL676_013908 [Syzygium grande]|nr:hypothetical protein NL676_013908 [Syzygium grande]